jgi:hypothetical protein
LWMGEMVWLLGLQCAIPWFPWQKWCGKLTDLTYNGLSRTLAKVGFRCPLPGFPWMGPFHSEMRAEHAGTPGRGLAVTIELAAPAMVSPTTAGMAVEIAVEGRKQTPRPVRRMEPSRAWASSGDRRRRRPAGTRCNGRRNDRRRNGLLCGKPRATPEKSRPIRG